MALRPLALPALVVTLWLSATGCATRTVYVVDGDRPAPAQAAAPMSQPAPVADVAGVDQFHQPLNAYGRWYPHASYGNIWVPSRTYAGVGWRPYTQGYWAQTEYGWTWVSSEPFGWATYHYGRWYYDAMYGWVWVPGTQWAPAWVTWRTGGSYVGWAPMGPGAYYGSSYVVYDSAWVFVSYRHFGSPMITNVIIVDGYNDALRDTRPDRTVVNVGSQPIYRGPEPDRIANEGGTVVRRPIQEIDRETPTRDPPSGTVVQRNPNRGGGSHDGSSGTGTPRTPRDERSGGGGGSDDDRSGGSGSDDRSGGAVSDDRTGGSRPDRGTSTDGSTGIPGLPDARPDRGGGTPVDDRSGGRGEDDRSGGRGDDDRSGGRGDGITGTDGRPREPGRAPGHSDINPPGTDGRDPRDPDRGRTPSESGARIPGRDGRDPSVGGDDGRTPDRGTAPGTSPGRATDPEREDNGPFVPGPPPVIPDASNRIPVDTSGPPSSIPPPTRAPDTRGGATTTPPPRTGPSRTAPPPTTGPSRTAPPPRSGPSRAAPPPSQGPPSQAAPPPPSQPPRAAPPPAKKENKKRDSQKKDDDKGDRGR